MDYDKFSDGFIDMSTLEEDVKKHSEEMAKQVYLEGANIILNIDYEYVVELDRCKTYQDILGWINHLGVKGWFTRKHIVAFLRVACNANDLDVPFPH